MRKLNFKFIGLEFYFKDGSSIIVENQNPELEKFINLIYTGNEKGIYEGELD